ncbi:MAG: methane monooxygenase [Candidatus Dormibacteraeota bacterium]|nr:methane monooxygenase [Candidatus Dormibacteraeota bacterium]
MAATLEQVHDKAKDYDWTFTVGDQSPKHPTKYIIPPKGKDPFRMLVRDYMRMEAEKDDRTYGFLDAAVRMRTTDHADPRLMEVMKLTLPDFTIAEFEAVSACGGIIASTQNQEIRQGYHAQMMDEIRHTQLEMSLRQYYAKHWEDPAGYDIGQKALYELPGGLIGVSAFLHFNTGDPIDCVIHLNVVLETAYTNILVVAIPQVAVVNGEDALPATFLSIQSDESRHMANGYGTLMAVLQDERNVPDCNRALERYFWLNHRQLDALTGHQAEYGATTRPWSYRKQWEEWVGDDFLGSYMERFTEFGLRVPERASKVADDVTWLHHTTGMALSAIWPLNHWRSPLQGPKDFEWFEANYPGWHGIYGGFWEAQAQMVEPDSEQLMLQQLPSLPPFCQVCQLPCMMPRPDKTETRIFDHDGKRIAVCSEGCEWIFKNWPTAYGAREQFWSLYHGWDLADVILKLGLVREDGKTLIGQPSLDVKRMWTIDDIRRLNFEVKDPLQS